jgi:hypothetical protein
LRLNGWVNDEVFKTWMFIFPVRELTSIGQEKRLPTIPPRGSTDKGRKAIHPRWGTPFDHVPYSIDFDSP